MTTAQYRQFIRTYVVIICNIMDFRDGLAVTSMDKEKKKAVDAELASISDAKYVQKLKKKQKGW